MSEQNTLFRTLEMMAILSRPGGASTRELAEHYDMTMRTIQRTIWTIREAGYVVDEKNGRYSINQAETKKKNAFDIGDLLHFSKEEAGLLKNIVQLDPEQACLWVHAGGVPAGGKAHHQDTSEGLPPGCRGVQLLPARQVLPGSAGRYC